MPGRQQADAQGLGLERAVKPRLAGQEHVGARAGGVREEIVAGAAGDGHPLDRPIRVAGDRHGNAPEHSAGKQREFLEAAGFAIAPDPAGAGRWCVVDRAFVERIDVDRGLFVGMFGTDRREDIGELSRRANEFEPQLAEQSSCAALAHGRVGQVGPKKRTLAGDRKRAFLVCTDAARAGRERRGRNRLALGPRA